MSGDNTQPLDASGQDKNQKEKKGAGGKGIVIGLVVCGVLALGGMATGLMGIMGVAEVQTNTSQTLKAFAKKVTEKIESSNNNVDISEADRMAIADHVTDMAMPKVEEMVDNYFESNRDLIMTNLHRSLSSELTKATSSGLTENQVNDIVNDIFERRSKALVGLVNQKMSTLQHLENQSQDVSREVEAMKNKLESLKAQWVATNNKPSAPKKNTKPRQRLKEFNLYYPPLKDGKLFIVDAPTKQGKESTITLTVGEGFRSKFGYHRVEGTDEHNGQLRLLITGNYFIDETREELSDDDKSKIAAKLAEKKKSEEPKAKATAVAKQVKKKKTQRVDTAAVQKMYLKGWKVITPIAETQRVVVYNPNTERAQQLSHNDYIAGVGTVRNIDFKSGETCFEKYCIQGLKF